MKKSKYFLLGTVLLMCVGMLTACGNDNDAEGNTNGAAGEIVTQAGKGIEEIATDIGDGIEDAGKGIENGVENASKGMDDTNSGSPTEKNTR